MKKTMRKIFDTLIHLLNILLIGLSFVLIGIALFKPELFEQFIEWMRWVVQWLGNRNYLIAFCSAFLESFPFIGMLLPWQNIMLIVGWFFSEHLQIMIWVAIAGALLGNYVWYILWRYRWDKFFDKYGYWIGIGKTEVNYMKKWITKHWWWVVAVGKFHNMTRSFIPFIAWSMGMKQKSFFVYNAVWSIIRAFTIILLWVVFVQYYKVILKYAPTVLGIIMVCVVLYIYLYKKKEFMKYWKEKEKEWEEQIEKYKKKLGK